MPSIKKPPLGAGGELRLKFGYGGMLAQSEKVAKAFGPDRGYRLMVMTVFVKAIVACLYATLAFGVGGRIWKYLIG